MSSSQWQLVERRLQYLEQELEAQKNFNQQIMKQMRKLEYSLHQQKK